MPVATTAAANNTADDDYESDQDPTYPETIASGTPSLVIHLDSVMGTIFSNCLWIVTMAPLVCTDLLVHSSMVLT